MAERNNVLSMPRRANAKWDDPQSPAPEEDPVEPGGRGPHDPGMEARVAKIEARLDHIDQTLVEIKVALAPIAKLPTKGELFAYSATVAALAIAFVSVVAAIFAYRQDTFIAISDRAIQAAQQPAPPPAQPIIIQIPMPAPAPPPAQP